jgi:chromosome segregation ATPase
MSVEHEVDALKKALASETTRANRTTAMLREVEAECDEQRRHTNDADTRADKAEKDAGAWKTTALSERARCAQEADLAASQLGFASYTEQSAGAREAGRRILALHAPTIDTTEPIR